MSEVHFNFSFNLSLKKEYCSSKSKSKRIVCLQAVSQLEMRIKRKTIEIKCLKS